MNGIVKRLWSFDWISALIAAPIAVVLAYMINAAIDRTPPIIYESAKVLTATVPQGGTIEVEFTVFRHRICDATVRRWLTDSEGARHSIPTFTVGPRTQLAGLDTYRRTITIPESVALGMATYEVELAYTCNMLHRLGWPIDVESPEVHFEVTPRPVIILPSLELPAPNDG